MGHMGGVVSHHGPSYLTDSMDAVGAQKKADQKGAATAELEEGQAQWCTAYEATVYSRRMPHVSSRIVTSRLVSYVFYTRIGNTYPRGNDLLSGVSMRRWTLVAGPWPRALPRPTRRVTERATRKPTSDNRASCRFHEPCPASVMPR